MNKLLNDFAKQVQENRFYEVKSNGEVIVNDYAFLEFVKERIKEYVNKIEIPKAVIIENENSHDIAERGGYHSAEYLLEQKKKEILKELNE
jgi:predicted component of viral defense system (DUF524 family)